MIFQLQILAWLGFVFLILSYFLAFIKKIRPKKFPVYHLLNLLGLILLLIYFILTLEWIFLILVLIWIIILIPILIKSMKPNKEYKDWTY